MERIVKARKIHKCVVCHGNIQKGEKYKHLRERYPEYDNNDKQIGVFYSEFRRHNKDCFPRLLNFENQKEILKNCNFGVHSPTYNLDPDCYDNTKYCKWCGMELK